MTSSERPDPTGITEHLDLALGDGPAHRPLDARLAAGRRALRRRRAVGGVAAVAVLTAAGVTYAAAGGPGTSGVDPAVSPTAAPPSVPADCGDPVPGEPAIPVLPSPQGATTPGAPLSDAPSDGDDGSSSGPAVLPTPRDGSGTGADDCYEVVPPDATEPAGLTGYTFERPLGASRAPGSARPAFLTADGELVVAPGVVVLRTIPDPLHLAAPDRSLAVVLEADGARRWAVATVRVATDGGCARWTFEQQLTAETTAPTLEKWVAALDPGPFRSVPADGGCQPVAGGSSAPDPDAP